MLLTAFTGQLLANMTIQALDEGLSVGTEVQEMLRVVASAVPGTVSVTWLNWIIFRVTIILPLNYLLQINSFIFHAFGMNSCSRLVRGGGPGGPVPYRIYIDSAVVLMWYVAVVLLLYRCNSQSPFFVRAASWRWPPLLRLYPSDV